MFFYRVPAPDEAMLISGGRVKGEGNAPFRVVTGRGAFVMPAATPPPGPIEISAAVMSSRISLAVFDQPGSSTLSGAYTNSLP